MQPESQPLDIAVAAGVSNETMARFMNLFGKQEPLLPELRFWVEEHGDFGMCLKHPLIFNMFHVPELNAIINDGYRQKKQLADEAFQARDAGKYCWLHERPYRFQALLEIAPQVKSHEKFWTVFRHIWMDSENIWQAKPCIKKLLRLNRPGRSALMTAAEKESLSKMPLAIQVYRGYQIGLNRDGMSWTTDHDKAWWFAQRFSGASHTPQVASRVVNRAEVSAYFTGRGEHEIVLFGEADCLRERRRIAKDIQDTQPKHGRDRQTNKRSPITINRKQPTT